MISYLNDINKLIEELRQFINSDNFITIEKAYWYENFIALFPIILDLNKSNYDEKVVYDNFCRLLDLVINNYDFRKNQEKTFIPTQFIEENL